MIEIRLSRLELHLSERVGTYRNQQALKDGCSDQHGADPEEGLQLNIIGAQGEMAFCKAANLYWEPRMRQYQTGEADVGTRTEVRTRRRHHYDLILRDNDPEDRLYGLVTIDPLNPAVFHVHGVCDGRASRMEKWRKEHGGREAAWFVPQEALVCLREWPGLRF